MTVKVCALVAPGADAVVQVARGLGETVALRVGPPGAADEAPLRRALALGAARAVRVWDPALQRADYLGLASALAATVRHLGCGLVVAGDRGHGLMGPTVAERLDLPHLCGVLGAAWIETPDGPRLRVRRRIRAGVQELRGAAAAVLCVLGDSAADAPVALADAAAASIEALELEQLGLRPAELVQRRGALSPMRGGDGLHPRPLVLPSTRALLERLRRDGLLRR